MPLTRRRVTSWSQRFSRATSSGVRRPAHRAETDRGPTRLRAYRERVSGRLAGRRALVTGSSRGIGRAIAATFLSEGAKVAINSRDSTSAESAARELGKGAVGVAGDVTTEAGISAVFRGTIDKLGGLDILVNNAGMNIVKDSLEMSPDEWRRVIELNLTAPFLCSQAAGRHMVERGGGCIINIGSITSFAAFPRRAPYATSKAGLAMLTKVLAAEWAGHGIRVNAIAPGFIQTALTEELVEQGKLDFDAVRRRTPMNRLGSEDEIARVALFLASDDATFVTGEAVVADGGWLAYGFV